MWLDDTRLDQHSIGKKKGIVEYCPMAARLREFLLRARFGRLISKTFASPYKTWSSW